MPGNLFYHEDPGDPESTITVVANGPGGVYVTVTEERAMDSYNQTFEIGHALGRGEACRLLEFLRSLLEVPHGQS